MTVYNWQQQDWPNFRFDLEKILPDLYEFEKRAGQIEGTLKSLPADVQIDHVLQVMVEEAIKTSEIEGVYLSRKDVMSSIRANLGLSIGVTPVRNQQANGISEMLLDVRKSFNEPLSHDKLFQWHTLLMADSKYVSIGNYRTHAETMQVVSKAAGKDKIHFEAPPSSIIHDEM